VPYVPLAHAGRIAYAERGERRDGHPSAVLIHGAGASGALWSMALAQIARHAHAIAIDLPAHGASSPEGRALDGSGALSLTRYRDAVGELAGALCLGPSVLVGHSLGALVAVEAALAWPDKVRALVLCGAGPRLPPPEPLLRLLHEDPAEAPAWLAEHGLSPQARPSIKRGFAAAGAATSVEIGLVDFDIVRATDLGTRLGGVGCPMTWLDGADDRIVPIETAGMAERPGEIVTLPGVGHMVPIEAPGAVAEAVRAATGATSKPR
jgi:pimeloyl-ACP methyl ester carboxylesterase